MSDVRLGADKHAEARDLETDIRSGEIAPHIRLSKEIPERMAIKAAADADEILAGLELGVGGQHMPARPNEHRPALTTPAHPCPYFSKAVSARLILPIAGTVKGVCNNA